MPATYPTHPSLLTSEWLTAQLRASGALKDGRITGFTTEPVGEGVGMLGILVRVTPTYDRPEASAPKSFIAKFATPIVGNRTVAMVFKLYEREVSFYTKIAPNVRAAAPICYAGEIDPTTGDSVLLLEDLAGYRMGDQVAGCTAAEAFEIIDAVVPLHVKYWGRADEIGLPCVPHIDGDLQIAGISGGCEVGWDPCVERFGASMAEEIKASKSKFVPAVPALHHMIGGRTQTVIHGDVRLDNLMFGVTPGQHPVVLVDWSLTISTGLHDVAYLLSQNVKTEQRRANEAALLSHYHKRLGENGITYSLDQVWEDYKVAVLYLLSYAIVIGGTLDPSNERGANFMSKLIERSSTTVMDHDLLSLLPS